MLEGESGEDRGGGDDEHDSAGPQHHPRRRRRIGLADASISEGIFGDEEAADHHGKETGRDQSQPLLDEAADRLAIMAQQLGLDEEARPRVMIDSSTNMKKL